MITEFIRNLFTPTHTCVHEYIIYKETPIYKDNKYACYCDKCGIPPAIGVNIISRCTKCGDIKVDTVT
jgi:hypothetical protein